MPTNPNLKHVYDNSNKVTDVGLSVTYRQNFNGQYWEITRMAKKQYQFIGMDKATAYECAAAKRTQYTRAFARIDTTNDSPASVSVVECPSDIAPQHRDGDVWSVSISVNEQDIVASQTRVTDPATLFTDANARNYDEDAGLSALSITSAERSDDTVAIEYEAEIVDFDPSRLICQYKVSESATTWTSLACESSGDDEIEASPVPTTGDLFVRLVYGRLESNTIVVE